MRIANYEYADKIGQGAFGTIYKGYNIRTKELVVVKMEPLDVEFSTLKHESSILNILYSKHCRSIPPTYWYGTFSKSDHGVDASGKNSGRESGGENGSSLDSKKTKYVTTVSPSYRVLVMPFYEESLEQFVVKNVCFTASSCLSNHRFCLQDSKETSLSPRNASPEYFTIASNIMRSAISILNHIHDNYVVHRDIKPANFMIHNNELILIDFGLASFYVDSEERHLPQANPTKMNIIGTPKYASWNVHCGEEYSRRDDLISMVYIGLFLLYGQSIWSDIPSFEHSKATERFSSIQQSRESSGFLSEECKTSISYPLNDWFKLQKKMENVLKLSADWTELCQFAKSVYALSFQERPSYKNYIDLFSKTI